ncbi:oligopeptide ABC transporter substrate-binding protein [Desemzia sp. RIT804]|uniref:oligopeptide ABC transporter substrate-binding protein n=1 Tax=Desemzia sp. RIT 804 TaxID=2810209 RepID=UPI001951A83D|nr:oligopeptide ABC transporter substrate-binding protein [Desemzia sp. RIT 804]MBM6613676.1 oligopeptide ABC transporter substrate-binding protein [Desemzia sp. RIT 804]
MSKRKLGLLTGSAALALILAACGGGTDDATESSANGGDASEGTESEGSGVVDFETVVTNEGEVMDGGTLNVALVTSSPFQGIFSHELYEDAYDADLMQFAIEEIFSTDENFQITNDGAVSLDFDQEAKTATLTVNEGVTWSDGEPVTSEDLLYSYEVIGHPDYTGIRYDANFTNIVGMAEYKSGEADTISGITVNDDTSITIEYLEVHPGMLQSGGGIWSGAMPKHHLEDVAIADLEGSEQIRSNPLGFGPFAVSNIVPGESVEFVANEYYYKGAPVLDSVIVEVVPPESIVAALSNGEYDVALKMPTDEYPTYADLPGYTLLGREELAYTYIGFKLGTWDSEASEVVTNPDAKMSSKELRQAMGYAIDNDAVATQFYNGLRSNANTAIIPAFGDFHNADVEGYTYNPDLANQLLDDAGFEDTDGDGFREDQDGEQLVINFASMAGGDTAEPIAEYYMQSWQQIGLNVQLTDGRLLEFNSFYDRLEADDEGIDIYQGAWGTGTDPNPEGLYGRNSAFNYTRWSSDENDALLDKISGRADDEEGNAWDSEWIMTQYHDWQQYFSEEAPIIPTLFRNEVLPVNNRVAHYDWGYDADPEFGWHAVGVTQDEAVTE